MPAPAAPEPSAAPPRWRLILNGKSAGDDDLREAVAAMRARGVRLDVRVTWEAGDAERYVAEAIADGVDTIVAAGGDGTLSEVAANLAGRDADADALPAMGLVPLGTANDFAAAAGIPLEPRAALELVFGRPATAIDLLRIDNLARGQTHWCANLASGGFGTQVTVETDEGLKKLLGGLAYLVTGIARLGRIDPIEARFSATSVDGDRFAWQGGFIALGIGNGRQAGGGQVLCRDALVDDDLLELTIVPTLEGEVAATIGAVLTRGRQAALDRVAVRARLPWVQIEADEPFVLNLDGEPVESTRFRVDCVAHRVRMHLPAGCALLGPSRTAAEADKVAR
jgi:lipid kinase YegS